MGCANLLFENSDEIFVPVLGTANELLEMIILHTIEKNNKVNFGKINFKKFISHNLAGILSCLSKNK